MTRIIGIVPARMAATRFPGKPLHQILGRPMVEHVFRRAQLFPKWDALVLATCDQEIAAFGASKGFPVVMTAETHTRALDRVAEAAPKCGIELQPDDIVVNVQGDEPMMHPDMIAASIKPLVDDATADCTLLGMEIVDERLYRNPDILKVVHDLAGNVLYTSRSPIPYCKSFSPALGARRIYGIFAFRWHFLQTFTRLPQSPLEMAESCDSNRIFDHGYRQKVAPFPYRPSYSVDSPPDTALVEAYLEADSLWGSY
jgi:3-deoxy-manno-octulosonate cytidylyltransferase (CMP-KDO synthetase)